MILLVDYSAQLRAMNESLEVMKRHYEGLNKATEKNRNLNNLNRQELRQIVKEEEGLKRRTQIMNTTLAMNNDLLKLNTKTLLDYRKAGGTTFEFLATFMTSTSEKVRLLGIEAASARRFMYGFLPPGMFRLVNKTATAFNGMGSALRAIRDIESGEGESNNIFKTIASAGKIFPTFSSVKGVMGQTVGRYRGRGRPRNIDYASTPFTGRGQRINTRREQAAEYFKRVMGAGKEDMKSRYKAMGESAKKVFDAKKWKEAGDTFTLFAKGLGKALFKFVIMASIYITIFFGLLYLFKGPIIKGFEFLKAVVSTVLPVIIEGVSDIWSGISEIFQGLMEGDFIKMFGGMWEIIWGLLQIAFGVLMGAIFGVVGFLTGFFGKALVQGLGYVFGLLDGTKTIKEKIIRVLVIATIVAAFIFGLPVIIGAVVVGAVASLLVKLGIKKFLDKIPFFANGGVSAGGLAVVGEKGPELVSLSRGSRVYSNTDSRKMAGGTVNNFNITINAKDTSKAEMRRMADEIGRMINSKINRSTSSSTFR